MKLREQMSNLCSNVQLLESVLWT